MEVRANSEQVIKNIARVIRGNSKKIAQLDAVQSISITCTSDDHIRIFCELYGGGIVRYLIEGTRSGMTVTANTLTNEIIRKPRGIKPIFTAETDCWASDILKIVR